MATIDVKDAAGATVALEKPLAPGRAAATLSRPVALSNEDAAFLDGIEGELATLNAKDFATQTTLAAVLAKIIAAPATETTLASLATLLTTQAGYLDGIETLIGSTNTALAALPQAGAFSASATFTPAAASHVANDCNGAAGTFASMGLSAGRIIITSASLEIDGATAEATAWRLYLYNVTPPSAIADDGAWDLGSGDRASYLGLVDLGTAVDLGSTQWVESNGINKQVKLSGTSLFGYLVNLTTLTPANVAHIVTLHAVAA